MRKIRNKLCKYNQQIELYLTLKGQSWVKKHQVDTFFSNFLRDIGNGEVFSVQLPKVVELTQLRWKLPNSSITGKTTTKNTHSWVLRRTLWKRATLTFHAPWTLLVEHLNWSITDLLIKAEWSLLGRKYEYICKTAANSWTGTDVIPTVPKNWNEMGIQPGGLCLFTIYLAFLAS